MDSGPYDGGLRDLATVAGDDVDCVADTVVAFDTGGTFTDVAVVSQTHGFAFAKELSTPHAPAVAIISGVKRALADLDLSLAEVDAVCGATTLIINALIEYKGVPTALLTTAGFADVLEMRREHRYDNYDLHLELPQPYVPRNWRLGVEERVRYDGNVVTPLDEESVVAAATQLKADGVQAVAVCLLHSYRFAEHEQAIQRLLSRDWPEAAVTLSSELAPEIREYERMSTTVVNAYTQPIMARHVSDLVRLLGNEGFHGETTFMLSSGRTREVGFVAGHPAHALESGPAAGALAAAHVGRTAGYSEIISFDMGGTTAKICVMPRGVPPIARSFEIARTKRFHAGSGHPVRLPTVDLLEIGAGGGSIARVDQLGLIQVGPDSAGADPGPACYARGGSAPTVTDANLVLGYLDPSSFLGGDMWIDVEASRKAIETIAVEVAMDVVSTAWWIHSVVNSNMARATRVHVAEKGVDARKFALIAFGGAAGLHVARVAHEVGIRRVVCPPRAGVASAFGLLVAPAGVDAVVSSPGSLLSIDPRVLRAALDVPLDEACDVLHRMGVPGSAIATSFSADMRYRGQAMEIEVELPTLPSTDRGNAWLRDVRVAFEQQYEFLYGRTFSHLEVEVMNWRLALSDSRTSTLWIDDATTAAQPSLRSAYFAETDGYVEAPTHWRSSLEAGWTAEGPLIIQERESTIIVPPFASVEIDNLRNVVVTL